MLSCLWLHSFLEYNPQIYVHEEGIWETYGRYDAAIGDITPLMWEQQDTGQLVLSVVTVCCISRSVWCDPDDCHPQQEGFLYPNAAVNRSDAHLTVATPITTSSAGGSLSDTLAERLGIPPHLFKRHGFVSLQHAYERYKAFNAAH